MVRVYIVNRIHSIHENLNSKTLETSSSKVHLHDFRCHLNPFYYNIMFRVLCSRIALSKIIFHKRSIHILGVVVLKQMPCQRLVSCSKPSCSSNVWKVALNRTDICTKVFKVVVIRAIVLTAIGILFCCQYTF